MVSARAASKFAESASVESVSATTIVAKEQQQQQLHLATVNGWSVCRNSRWDYLNAIRARKMPGASSAIATCNCWSAQPSSERGCSLTRLTEGARIYVVSRMVTIIPLHQFHLWQCVSMCFVGRMDPFMRPYGLDSHCQLCVAWNMNHADNLCRIVIFMTNQLLFQQSTIKLNYSWLRFGTKYLMDMQLDMSQCGSPWQTPNAAH